MKQINQTVVNSYTFILFKVLKKVTVIDRYIVPSFMPRTAPVNNWFSAVEVTCLSNDMCMYRHHYVVNLKTQNLITGSGLNL